MSSESTYRSVLSCYQKIEPSLRNQVQRITHNSHVAEEVLQETLARGLQKSTTEQIRTPAAWLRRVASNLAIDYFRTKKPKPLGSFCEQVRDPRSTEQYVGHVASGLSLEQMVGCLPSKYAEILVLRYRDRMDYSQISERLGIPRGSAKNMACRAREQLRTRYGNRD